MNPTDWIDSGSRILLCISVCLLAVAVMLNSNNLGTVKEEVKSLTQQVQELRKD